MEREEAIQVVRGLTETTYFDDRELEGLRTLIPELAESEDERTRRELIEEVGYLLPHEEEYDDEGRVLPTYKKRIGRYRAYLEKQKEQKPSINIDQLKSLMLQYLQEAANEKDDSDIEADTDKWARKILGYNFEQKPAEWGEEDEKNLELVTDCVYEFYPDPVMKYKLKDWLTQRLKSLRPQPRKEIYQAARHDLALRFMNYLDENRPEDKMSLSNGECEDIDKAFKENDWAKIMRYIKKYSSHWKPSNEQIQTLIKIHGNSDMPTQQILGSLITELNNLKKL